MLQGHPPDVNCTQKDLEQDANNKIKCTQAASVDLNLYVVIRFVGRNSQSSSLSWTIKSSRSEFLPSSPGLSVSHLLVEVGGRFHLVGCTFVEWVPHSQVACGDRSIWARLLSKTNRPPT